MRSSTFSKEHDDRVTGGGAEIRYRYRYSNRRTLGIRVSRDLSVMVTAPRGTPVRIIRDFVRERAGWIIRAWRMLERRTERPALRYVTGEAHRYIGQSYRLEVLQGQKDAVRCEADCLMVTSRMEPDAARTKALLEHWYRRQAAALFYERLCMWHERLTAGKGKVLPGLRIRAMKSRWGSCSSTGWITLNLLLILEPERCIDYVIVHELCHLTVRGHGPDFWRLVEHYIPDYRERRKELKEGDKRGEA